MFETIKDNLHWVIIIVTALFLTVISFYSFHKEADLFNRFSDQKITWVDAMFGDFRILPTKN